MGVGWGGMGAMTRAAVRMKSNGTHLRHFRSTDFAVQRERACVCALVNVYVILLL